MSQSTKKSNLGFALFLIFLIIIAGLVTYLFIYNHNLSTSKIPEYTEDYFTFKEVEESIPVDVFAKYPVNPITITYDDGVKISGLKDKSIENKINLELKDLEPYKFQEKPSCYVNFNVSNILSLTCKNKSATFNLTTGNHLTLEEIFNKDSNLYSITMDALYQSFCTYGDCYLPREDDSDYEYYNSIENDLIASYQNIEKGNYDLVVTYSSLILNLPNLEEYTNITYSFDRYYNDITIFNRYKTTESIFENDITDYCNVESCYLFDFSHSNNTSYNTGSFITAKNYLTVNIYNNTRSDVTMDNDYPLSDLDLPQISQKITNELMLKNNLKRETNNYQNITLNIDIYNTAYNYKLITYNLVIKEMTKENFIKNSLGAYEVDNLNNQDITKVNMILTSNNNIAYQEEEPTEIFADFTDTLYTYILEDLATNSYSPFIYYSNLCEIAENYDECINNLDYKALINDASYMIDLENHDLLMYYLKNIGGGMTASAITKLPYDIFTLK